MWSILFPDFPGVTSAASDFADVPQQARDALATAVEDMIAEGENTAGLGRGGRPGRGRYRQPPPTRTF